MTAPFLLTLIRAYLPFGSIASQHNKRLNANSFTCRYLPGDSLWPTLQAWTNLNTTVGGKLVKTVPLASPCHGQTYNEVDCAALKESWVYPQTYFNSSSGFLAPYFQNQSCDPFTPESSPCTLGNDVEYAINATSAQDVVVGLQFAQEMNVRLVIKNTGHDLLGRSTGKGALSIWTHYLKNIDFLDYHNSDYSGPALKLGAGVQGWEAYEAADSRSLRIIGSTCPTVGVAGGFTQGGGHSDLSSTYGLSADQVLEWEVVTANGDHVTSSASTNSDLFWALSGGGGGTYAVVLSVTVKAFPDGPIGGASLSFASSISQDTYWNAITAFHSSLPIWVDQGGSAAYTITNESFYLQPATFPGLSTTDVIALLQPLISHFESLEIHYSVNFTYFSSYLTHFSHYYGPLPYGIYPSAQVQGGRMIPRSVVQNENASLSSALRNITASGAFYIIGVALNVSHSVAGNSAASNAVLPSWRETLITMIVASVWDYTLPLAENDAHEEEINKHIDPLLQSVTGTGSGVYMNEGDFQQADYQTQFYGSNYRALKSIKKTYDPNDLFYATTAVGSEAWTVAGDGRLCRSESS